MVQKLYLSSFQKKEDYYIKPSMIENPSLLEALKCSVCSNIFRRP